MLNDAGFNAAARNDLLALTNGSAFTVAYFIPHRVNAGTVAGSINASQATFGGTPAPGETWTINLGTSVHNHVVRENVPLAEIAANLAASINAGNASSHLSATVQGTTLVIEDSQANGFTSAFSITPSATTARRVRNGISRNTNVK